eukprot:189285-Prymnesium_polylepis.1
MPNPTSFERGLLYSIYAVEGRRDTWNMPDGAPSMRALLARAHEGTLTPSLKPRRLASWTWSTPSIMKRYHEVLVEGCGRCPLVDSNVSDADPSGGSAGRGPRARTDAQRPLI